METQRWDHSPSSDSYQKARARTKHFRTCFQALLPRGQRGRSLARRKVNPVGFGGGTGDERELIFLTKGPFISAQAFGLGRRGPGKKRAHRGGAENSGRRLLGGPPGGRRGFHPPSYALKCVMGRPLSPCLKLHGRARRNPFQGQPLERGLAGRSKGSGHGPTRFVGTRGPRLEKPEFGRSGAKSFAEDSLPGKWTSREGNLRWENKGLRAGTWGPIHAWLLVPFQAADTPKNQTRLYSVYVREPKQGKAKAKRVSS